MRRHRISHMLIRALLVMVLTAGFGISQQPTAVDTSNIGPQVGAMVPAFEGIDQFGNRRSLSSVYGPKGAMLVFFRSSDW
jgi:hypothetical protein